MTPEAISAVVQILEFKPSAIHGVGVFARRDIAAGAMLIEYVGKKITKEESLRRCAENNAYIFALNAEQDIDGSIGWNPAKFINHSCAPNCDAENVDGQIWILARRGIKAGEELTFNYGYDFESYREHPCRCGHPACAGYIVAEEFLEAARESHLAEQPGSD